MSLRNTSNLVASSQLTGGGGGGLEVLWEWNGSDITQFGNGSGTPDSTYGSPDGTLSVEDPPSGVDVPSGSVLTYTTGTATNAFPYFKINDLPTLPERYIFRARLGPDGSGCKPYMLWGQDSTHHAAFTWSGSQSTWELGNNSTGIYEGGHYLRSGGSSSIQSGQVFEIDCMIRQPDTGVDPQFNFWVVGPGISSVCSGKGGPSWTNWGSWSAIYHSSWQSGGSITPSISFHCNGTAKTSWASEMQILAHPWTKEA